MLPLLVFLLGFSVTATAGLSTGLGGSSSWTVVAVALGVLASVRQATRDETRRCPLFPSRVAPCFSALVLAAALVVGVAMPAIAFGLVLAAGLAGGFLIGTLCLYLGVQKTSRIGLASAFMTGLAAAILLASYGAPALLYAAPGSALLIGLLTRHPAVRDLDMASPIPGAWASGPMTLAGTAVVGFGLMTVAQAIAGEPHPWIPLAVWVAGAWLGPPLQPRSRRIAMQLGSTAMLVAALLAFAADWSPDGDEATLRLIAGSAAACLVGAMFPFLPRFYAMVPLGSNILGDIPPAELRAPIGAALRLAAMLLGAAVALCGCVVVSREWSLVILAGGGAASLLFDPRAGVGRKVIALFWVGAPATVALWLMLR